MKRFKDVKEMVNELSDDESFKKDMIEILRNKLIRLIRVKDGKIKRIVEYMETDNE